LAIIKSNLTILFISHDAYRTGAPILLLNLASLLRSKGFEIEFLLKKEGELTDEFKSIGNTRLAQSSDSFLQKIKRKLFKSEKAFDNISNLPWDSYSCVLSNTITNGNILPIVRKYYKGKIFSYIHELEIASMFFTNEQDVAHLLETTDHYLVPCEAVERFLERKYNIPASRIDLLPYYIPKKNTSSPEKKINETSFLVGGVGTPDWRKSPDLFIQVGAMVFKLLPEANILFVWKGVSENNIDVKRLEYDIEKAGLTGRVLLERASGDMPDFYNQLNLLLLTSREDPYPLVVLEAAAAAVPTICFENSGGAIEFVQGSKGGTTVPYLHVQAMATEVINFYQNRQAQETAGQNAKNYLERTHEDKDFVYEQFCAVFKKLNIE
jgi:glycosyltransferase involved in cell wall biosynthesis